ncbi:MAG: hypothetical protein KIS86_06330 [Devosia sp.]|nr:hypothetical protein [Devosia sp.]
MADELNSALTALQSATEAYQSASSRAANARREETDAINALNLAQKKFDDVVLKLKQAAPAHSDWKNRIGER